MKNLILLVTIVATLMGCANPGNRTSPNEDRQRASVYVVCMNNMKEHEVYLSHYYPLSVNVTSMDMEFCADIANHNGVYIYQGPTK